MEYNERHRTAFAFLLLLLPVAAKAQRPTLSENVRQVRQQRQRLVAITGVTVIDGRGTPAVRGQTVVIRDGRIAEVGAIGQGEGAERVRRWWTAPG